MSSEDFLPQVDEALQHEVAQRHSYFQLKYFVVGKEPTTQAKMWQCLREMKSRRESLTAIELEIEEAKDRVELLDIGVIRLESETPGDNLAVRESGIKLRQLKRKKIAAENSVLQLGEKRKWLLEELRFFLETFKNLQKVEPLKNYDDVDAQKQFWGEKLSQKLNLKMLVNNQLDTELVETIVALPDDIPIKKQAMQTLQVRHAHMLQALTSTAKNLEGRKNDS